ncbi:sulfurtransferase FdhD [Geothrix limicola]|uniref:Sulfur carrier protein FdhD n=1 Tax=Geothrix limicola TaxID=2927978 RepID=A0ABQ5QHS8_9BACT|nr:formate dehydrogenase accessory sulfurtransferase FdhD [Geothrix limicola]GLH74149.1 sulfurtransferase FdhD [Geothrix limicola]
MTPIARIPVQMVSGEERREASDALAIEEPLEIRLNHVGPEGSEQRVLSITMRTPGHDDELAAGFLFTEGILRGAEDLREVRPHRPDAPAPGRTNVVQVSLHDHVTVDLQRLERNFYTTSSCGICGKASIEALRAQSPFPPALPGHPPYLSSSLLHRLPQRLRAAQDGFEATGGLHAAALFDASGERLLLREDVGRHNAVDKVLGRALLDGLLPLRAHVLLVSGRASFELVQKASMAGLPCLAAVGAPSSLAVELAQEAGMTLVGFLREGRFNVYSGDWRVV